MRLLILSLSLVMITACSNGGDKNETDAIKKKYIKLGAEIASKTQSVLLKNVSQAMKKGGPEYAIEYCNLKALSLKDSLSALHNCSIKRISSKYRNPAGKPNTATDKKQLMEYMESFLSGESLSPNVYIFDDRIEYFQPITIFGKACLNCHGDPEEDIPEGTLKKINERYPDDLATGYALNELRGAWKITFER